MSRDVREKLVELVNDVLMYLPWGEIQKDTAERIVDRMLDHDVTVQEWISVTEMLPEAGGYVVCIAKRNPFSRLMPMVARIEKNGWVNPITEQYISEVAHWMPMPNPPKGE